MMFITIACNEEIVSFEISLLICYLISLAS